MYDDDDDDDDDSIHGTYHYRSYTEYLATAIYNKYPLLNDELSTNDTFYQSQWHKQDKFALMLQPLKQ